MKGRHVEEGCGLSEVVPVFSVVDLNGIEREGEHDKIQRMEYDLETHIPGERRRGSRQGKREGEREGGRGRKRERGTAARTERTGRATGGYGNSDKHTVNELGRDGQCMAKICLGFA